MSETSLEPEAILTIPTTSRLIDIGFNREDSLSPNVQAWCDTCGIRQVRISYGFLLEGSFTVSARDLTFATVEDAMMFKLRWL
ncbi:MAG: hypothetical protein EOP83_09940 [Verrucomicrobiaceae bacterium]|nr:MAG: hypothetical protein EOP83_09940 [Verrucomicrobiaceae bacterium]